MVVRGKKKTTFISIFKAETIDYRYEERRKVGELRGDIVVIR
jgi:hypothetical protein